MKCGDLTPLSPIRFKRAVLLPDFVFVCRLSFIVYRFESLNPLTELRDQSRSLGPYGPGTLKATVPTSVLALAVTATSFTTAVRMISGSIGSLQLN